MISALRRHAALVVLACALPAATAAQEPVRYEHRVVVATTSRDRAEDITESLEHNVNRLGALGYELTALAGGNAAILDAMLQRRAYQWGTVDHGGLTFAVMARPERGPLVARRYRLLHVRNTLELQPELTAIGADGYRMTVAALDGDIPHVAFEQTAGTVPAGYRLFRNRGRQTWMDQALADADTRQRLTRVMPVALDAAIVELGPPQTAPAAMQWLSQPAHLFSSLAGPLRTLAASGARVDLMRTRANDVSLLVVTPAGATGARADYALDEGPWGTPCVRGALAGVAVIPGGNVGCAMDRSGPAVTNHGLDLTVREQPTAGGHVLFRGPDCDVRARLESSRPAAPRVAAALQLEREIARALTPGFRVVHVLATSDSNGQRRLVTLTTDRPPAVVTGPDVPRRAAPPLVAEITGRFSARYRDLEDRVNEALANQPGIRAAAPWFEVGDGRPSQAAQLFGCVAAIGDDAPTAAAARDVLTAHGAKGYAFYNKLVTGR